MLDGESGKLAARVVPCRVTFRRLGAEQIERYLRLEQPYDCAGSAKAEGLGIALIARIDTEDPTSLIGLPLIALGDTAARRRLRRAGLMPGILYAIPTPLGGAAADALPASALATVRTLRCFVVENAKSARAFLKEVGMPCAVQDLDISVLENEIPEIHKDTCRQDQSIGLLSEAGCPAIADPGAALVAAAQAAGIRVVPLVGPSSIVLALMASGLEGQRFAFCGYLPREPDARKKKIGELEARSRRGRETQIFIETPYRNDADARRAA